MTRATPLAFALMMCAFGGLAADAFATESSQDRSHPSRASEPPRIEPGRTMRPHHRVTPFQITAEKQTDLSDRCRTIVEFAQLGDIDATGIDELRRGCG